MAITVAEALADQRCDWQVLATDLSSRALETAEAGVYEVDRLEGLSTQQRRSFVPCGAAQARVCDELREHVSFARLDLAHPPFPMKGPFDVIFCRNVMIYLGTQERAALVANLERLLARGGRLALSPAEGIVSLHSGLTMVNHALYLRP